jgi:hypothetical protein
MATSNRNRRWKQHEIDEILFASGFQAVLASNGRKHSTHFQEERRNSGEDRLFPLALNVVVGRFQEVECVFVIEQRLLEVLF